MLIRLDNKQYHTVEDRFVTLADEDVIPATGGLILSLARFQSEGEALLADGRELGVKIGAAEAVEDLAYDLPRLAVVALDFPKYRDGRAYSSAVLLRERYGFAGEVRAVGDVLVDQAWNMARCGFDAFEVSVGPNVWTDAVNRYRHVYQAAVDARPAAFEEREAH
jgi:uncharacterized protein (DUF934 family)